MIEFCEKALSYTAGLNQTAFLTNDRTYDATLRNLELIGEAATHIPVKVREVHLEIPWNSLIGVRNQLAHDYMSMDDALVWIIVGEGVPNLLHCVNHVSGFPAFSVTPVIYRTRRW